LGRRFCKASLYQKAPEELVEGALEVQFPDGEVRVVFQYRPYMPNASFSAEALAPTYRHLVRPKPRCEMRGGLLNGDRARGGGVGQGKAAQKQTKKHCTTPVLFFFSVYRHQFCVFFCVPTDSGSKARSV
jgi:hypothetical protein